MKPKFATFFLYLGVALFVAGIVWEVGIAIYRWDLVLTPHQKFLLYWKPALLMILGWASFYGAQKCLE